MSGVIRTMRACLLKRAKAIATSSDGDLLVDGSG